jgi:hypothetical protein
MRKCSLDGKGFRVLACCGGRLLVLGGDGRKREETEEWGERGGRARDMPLRRCRRGRV